MLHYSMKIINVEALCYQQKCDCGMFGVAGYHLIREIPHADIKDIMKKEDKNNGKVSDPFN